MNVVSYEEYKKLQEKYDETARRLDVLMDNVPGGVFCYFAATGKFDFIGKGVLALFHCDEETFREHFYNSFDLFVFKADRKNVKEQIENQRQFFSSVEIAYRVQTFTEESQIIWVLHKAHLYIDEQGIEHYLVVINNVTEQRLAQDELQRINEQLFIETERYKLIEEAIEEVQFDYDVKSDVVTLSHRDNDGNRKQVEHFLKDNVMRMVVHPEDYDRANMHFFKALLEPTKDVLEYRSLFPTEQYVWYRMNYVSFADENKTVTRVVGILKDITEERLAEEAMKHKMQLDLMTGILNKVSIQNAIEKYLKECNANTMVQDNHHSTFPTQALLAIDTDFFKSVNDTLGHMCGDDVIKFVAKTLINTFKENDIIGRSGGDEFLVLMKNAVPKVVKERAHILNKKLHKRFTKDGKSVQISCSIGIAYYSEKAHDFETLFVQADQALYAAKNAGRNCFRIYEEL